MKYLNKKIKVQTIVDVDFRKRRPESLVVRFLLFVSALITILSLLEK